MWLLYNFFSMHCGYFLFLFYLFSLMLSIIFIIKVDDETLLKIICSIYVI